MEIQKLKILKTITDCGVVAVIRANSKDEAVKVIDAAAKGGIKAIEVTMTVPGAIDIIKEVSKIYDGSDVIVGAGTVLDSETARECILAGAKFIVSPYFDEGTVKLCNRYAVLSMPGAMTVKESIAALELGVDIIKVFPGSAFGPSIISAFKGPLPQGNFMPTGGVSLENAKDWIKAGAVAIGTGGQLTKGAKTGNYKLVEETAAKFVKAVKEARE